MDGYHATILSGVILVKGAVAAAGAVVVDVPPYAMTGGVPAGLVDIAFLMKSLKNFKVDCPHFNKRNGREINMIYVKQLYGC